MRGVPASPIPAPFSSVTYEKRFIPCDKGGFLYFRHKIHLSGLFCHPSTNFLLAAFMWIKDAYFDDRPYLRINSLTCARCNFLFSSGIFAGQVLQVSSVSVTLVSLFCSFLGAEFDSLPDCRRSRGPSRPFVLKRCIQTPVRSGHCIRCVAASFILKPLLRTVFAARNCALTLGSLFFL